MQLQWGIKILVCTGQLDNDTGEGRQKHRMHSVRRELGFRPKFLLPVSTLAPSGSDAGVTVTLTRLSCATQA